MIHYFEKTTPHNTFVASNGQPVAFTLCSNGQWNVGVIALDDDKPDEKVVAADLNKAIAERRGGIIKLTLEQYEELKKKEPSVQSRAISGFMGREAPLQAFQNPSLLRARNPSAAVVTDPPNGTPFQQVVQQETGEQPPARAPRRGPIPPRRKAIVGDPLPAV